MSNLSYLYNVGQKVRCKLDGDFYDGVVKKVYADHIIVDIPEINDHCWFENGFNMDCVYPMYNLNNLVFK